MCENLASLCSLWQPASSCFRIMSRLQQHVKQQADSALLVFAQADYCLWRAIISGSHLWPPVISEPQVSRGEAVVRARFSSAGFEEHTRKYTQSPALSFSAYTQRCAQHLQTCKHLQAHTDTHISIISNTGKLDMLPHTAINTSNCPWVRH